MFETGLHAVAHCINPDCPRPVVRSLTDELCPTCKTPLHLNDRYIPLQQLASNRYTATYRVYDQSTKADAVMKVLIAPSSLAVELFHRTPKVLSSMRCLGLPRVTVKSDFQVALRGSVQTVSCFVMELVPGKSLLKVIDECPNGCPEAWVMTWLKQLLEALQFLHGRQLVHGNLMPENVLLRDDRDQVVIIGFGNPKSAGVMSGAGAGRSPFPSNGYRPPETMPGVAPTATDDLYAIGRMGIHLLTGIHPLDLEDERTRTLRWQHRAKVSPRFVDLLEKLTHPQLESRYKTAAEVKSVLVSLMTAKEKPQWFKWGQRSRSKPTPRPGQPRRPAQQPELIMQDVSTPAIEVAFVDAALHLVQTMLNIGVMSGFTAAVSFWLMFCSPVASGIQAGLGWLSQALPLTVPPTLALFGVVGMSTAWGLLNLANDRAGWFWLATLLGGLGYGAGWLVWQGSPATLPALAVARMATVAGLFVTVLLCSKRHWLMQLVVTSLGSAVTMATLVRSQVFHLDGLTLLFSPNPAIVLPFELPLFSTVILFFASLGAAMCLWFRLSEQVAIPIVLALMGKHR
jgi:hypothetical protein